MAVYREGYFLLEQIYKNTKQVFNDAADQGAPVKKGDQLWNFLQYSVKAYELPETRKVEGGILSVQIKLIDEWAVSDARKTVENATEFYLIEYTPLKKWKSKPYLNPEFRDADGFLSFTLIK